MNVSKELLSEVLEVEVFDIVNDKNTPINMFQYEIKKRMLDGSEVAFREINIYELAYKCKEWANITKNVYLSSGFNEMDKKWEAMMMQHTFPASTEPEAIFKACQWILDNKDKQ